MIRLSLSLLISTILAISLSKTTTLQREENNAVKICGCVNPVFIEASKNALDNMCAFLVIEKLL